jgi:hypothetical protein
MEEKPLGNEFKCCVCLENPGKVAGWSKYIPELNIVEDLKQPLICEKCDKSLANSRRRGKIFNTLALIEWVAKRARDAEHNRMLIKVNDLVYKNSQAMRNLNRLMESKEALSAKQQV